MKNIYLPLIALAFSSLSHGALASNDSAGSELELEIGGKFDFQTGIRASAEDEIKKNYNVSDNHNNLAFGTKAEITTEVSRELENGLKYGAKIAMQPKTSPSFNNSYLYIEHKGGKFQFGNNSDAMSELSKTAFDLTRSSSWSKYATLAPKDKKIDYITYPDIASDELSLPPKQSEKARKVTYYTPELKGLQFGISYIPDSQNVGDGAPKNELIKSGKSQSEKKSKDNSGNSGTSNGSNDKEQDEEDKSDHPEAYPVRNAVAGGVNYKYQTEEDLGLEFSVTGEYGTSVFEDRNNLKSYNLGAIVSYKGLSFGVSYTDWRDSLIPKDLNKNLTSNIFTLGAGYETGPFGAGVVWLRSNSYENYLNGVNFSLDYKLAPQLTSYAEFTLYSTEGNRNKKLEKLDSVDKRKGSIVVLGTKLNL
jgi:hypothetical protein